MRRLATLLALAGAVACGKIDADELPGTYLVEYKFGHEILLLEGDGEYEQHVTVGDSSVVHRGHWTYDPKYRDVRLEDGLLVLEGFGTLNPDWRTPPGGFIIRSAHKWFLWSDLTLGNDEEKRYEKISK